MAASRHCRIACALIAAGIVAHADDATMAQVPGPTKAAEAAYDRGRAARVAGKFSVAAVEFALADELEPNVTALSAALEDAVRADDPVLGMTLVDRAARRARDKALDEATRAARDRFERRVATLVVHCGSSQMSERSSRSSLPERGGGATPCDAIVDGRPGRTDQPMRLKEGHHDIELTHDGKTETRSIRVDAGQTVTIDLRLPQQAAASTNDSPPPRGGAPRPPASPAETSGGGLSPTWFWLGTGGTVLLGGALVASSIDVKAKHDEYADEPNATLLEDGKGAQVRTNVLVAATVGAAAITAVVGLFFVRWSNPSSSPSASTRPRPRGLLATF